MRAAQPLQLFAPAASRELAGQVAARLGVAPGELEEREFEDGEHKARPLVDVRGGDVFVLHALYGEPQPGRGVNDKLCRLLFLLGALRDAGAARLTAVLPYLCYARKDRRTKDYDPVTTRYVAALLEAVGVDRVVAVDVHNPAAYENAFRCPTVHLEPHALFADHFASRLAGEEVVVLSPDAGGVKRAEAFRQALEVRFDRPLGSAFMEKYRSAGEVWGGTLVGQVQGRTVIVCDDLVASGTTLVRAARACRQAGAKAVWAAASHGLFVGSAGEQLRDPALEGLVVLDTVPPLRLPPAVAQAKLEVLDSSPLLAGVVERLHAGAC
ncbi:MAG TPA: ribose-phosphate diphosphokinase [Gammaproteobacteria bacterium]|nr:ribose-phosphate diphosphokinase [Gammaproteobacteria bacterium]